MGRMKEFGMEIGELIFIREWTNEQITEYLIDKYKLHGLDEWLTGQIEAVRAHPEIYDPNKNIRMPGRRMNKPTRKIYDKDELECTCSTGVAAGVMDGPLCPYCKKQADEQDIPY